MTEQGQFGPEQPRPGAPDAAVSPWARPGSPVHSPADVPAVPPAPGSPGGHPAPAYFPPSGHPPPYPVQPYPTQPYPVQPFAAGPPPVPREARQVPSRVVPVPGTSFGLAYLDVPPSTSGPAVGSLVAGIAAIGVTLVATCFGLAGVADGWGAWVAGAFAVLAGAFGVAGVGLALAGMRQVRRARAHGTIRVTGTGLAVSGLVCGSVGVAGTLLALAGVLLIQAG